MLETRLWAQQGGQDGETPVTKDRSSSPASEVRIWTDSRGRVIEAELAALGATEVLLRFPTGKRIRWPIAKLSPTDQQFLESHRKTLPPRLDLSWQEAWPEQAGSARLPEVGKAGRADNPSAGRHRYVSPHFIFSSDAELSPEVTARFSLLFEATFKYLSKLPLALDTTGLGGSRWPIDLFESQSAYVEAGGDARFAGYFLRKRGRGRVLVPLESLGVRRQGDHFTINDSKNDQVLAHEITHLMTPRPYFARHGHAWFTDGLAEFVATTPYRKGVYSTRNHIERIVSYVSAAGHRGKGGRKLGKTISLPALQDFLSSDYESFSGDQANRNYGAALLITAYFCYLDGQGKAARLKHYLLHLKENKKPEGFDALLRAQTWQDLEQAIVDAWKKHGIHLEFEKP